MIRNLLLLSSQIDLHLWRSKGRRLNKMQVRITATQRKILIICSSHQNHEGSKSYNCSWKVTKYIPSKFSGKVKKRLLKVVIALGWDLIVLQILLPVESNLLCFHLPVLHINLVPTKNNWDVFTHSEKATKRCKSIEHNIRKLWLEIRKGKTCRFNTNLQRSRCHVGTFLYVNRAVTSNMIIAHCPWMLHNQKKYLAL